jgi:hypothetical protein
MGITRIKRYEAGCSQPTLDAIRNRQPGIPVTCGLALIEATHYIPFTTPPPTRCPYLVFDQARNIGVSVCIQKLTAAVNAAPPPRMSSHRSDSHPEQQRRQNLLFVHLIDGPPGAHAPLRRSATPVSGVDSRGSYGLSTNCSSLRTMRFFVGLSSLSRSRCAR